jgi:hypothetical protein
MNDIKKIVLNKIAREAFRDYASWEKLIRDFGSDKTKQLIERTIDLTLEEMKKEQKKKA